jgi:hypothetical protein
MDNYPDDIRRYDHDPRSPFYDDSRERAVESALEDAATSDLPAQAERLGLSFTVEVDEDADEDGPYTLKSYQLEGSGVCEEDFAEVAKALATLDREHPDLAELVEAVIP